MARAAKNRFISLALACCAALLLAACEDPPESVNVRICKIIAEEYATNPSDMTFVSVFTNEDLEDESVHIEFDDINQFGAKVRRSAFCLFEGVKLRLLQIDDRYVPHSELLWIQVKAMTKKSRRDREARKNFWRSSALTHDRPVTLNTSL
ncbi:MAG: hypothetical protein L0210_09500 [Rhodospirillales bacterium]|nr:hypothetical protein [Rhodospirillales bacterium]